MQTHMLRIVVVIAVACGCTKTNPDFCNTNDDCSNGLVCNGPSHTCILGADASTADAPMCFGPAPFDVCIRAYPTEAITLPSFVSTDMDSTLCIADSLWKDAAQPPTCFIVAKSITVPATRVEGLRPLVVIATESIDVIGYVDASAHNSPYIAGPGAPASCSQFASAPQVATGPGGGAGASHRFGGASGGTGGGDAAQGTTNPILGVPLTLHAGCAGQSGANPSGSGGNGGGAIYFVSGATLRIGAGAIINVSGGGAQAPGVAGGGGGGGSGGMIMLQATDVIVENGAKLLANGGGGSSGGTASSNGSPGHDPDPTMPLVGASGGIGGGGAGGRGASQALGIQPGANATGSDGGGGGGGGMGYIRSTVPLANAVVSPDPHVVP